MFSLSKYLINSCMESEIFEAAYRHASKYGLEEDFKRDYSHSGSIYESLEEWDLLNEAIINEIEGIKERYR